MFSRKITTTFAATVLAAAVAVLAAGPSEGSSCLPLSSCGQFVQTSVFLTKDLDCAWTGMFIGASGITVDLNGHVLKGDGVGGHMGVADFGGYDNLTIKNGVVRNFDDGIHAVNGSDNVTVSKVVSAGNTNRGVDIEGDSLLVVSSTASRNGGPGIEVDGNSASIKSSTTAGNKSYGIRVVGNAASVRSSTAVGNVSAGIDLQGGDMHSVVSSTVSGNDSVGLYAGGNSVSITKTTASGNASHGIYVQGNGATLKTNQADGNGLSGGGWDGILVGGFTIAPTGTNVARGNSDPNECQPASLC